MPDADRNVEIIRELYERYTMGDGAEGVFARLAEDVVWRSVGPPSQLPFTRSRHGRDGVRAYFRALEHDWEMISYKVNELIGQRDRVVALADVCFCHRRTGKLMATAKADEARNVVVEPYLIDIAEQAGVRRPLVWREAIRAEGPTVRTDLPPEEAEASLHRTTTGPTQSRSGRRFTE